jgi:ATP/maltotriose-dependent transcriptional regulator MalT
MMGSVEKNKDFLGRQRVLQDLETCLVTQARDLATPYEQPQSQRYAVLCGTAGIGKTSIAIEFAFRQKDKFDAVFWVRAEDTAKLEAGEYSGWDYIFYSY